LNKLFATTAVAMLLGLSPAFAVEDASQQKPAEQAGQTGELPTTSTVTPDTAAEAKQPDNGSPDTSGAAMERSSAPPESGAVIDSESEDISKSSSAAGQSDSDEGTSKE
jgi:hypothetical protein